MGCTDTWYRGETVGCEGWDVRIPGTGVGSQNTKSHNTVHEGGISDIDIGHLLSTDVADMNKHFDKSGRSLEPLQRL